MSIKDIKEYILISLVALILMISGCVEEEVNPKISENNTDNSIDKTNKINENKIVEDTTKEKEIPFETIDVNVFDKITENRFIIILNVEDLHKLDNTGIYAIIEPDNNIEKSFKTLNYIDLSKIDFNDYFVIVMIRTGLTCQNINNMKIKKVNQIRNQIYLEVMEMENNCMPPGGSATQTSFYHIIKIKKSELTQKGNLTFVIIEKKEVSRKVIKT